MSLRRGALYLGGALILLAALGLRPHLEDTASILIGTPLALWLGWCAYRGGRRSLWLAKAFAFLHTLFFAIIALGVPIMFILGQRISPGFQNSLALIANVAAVGFSTWALFFSKDVRAFITAQQARHAPAPPAARPRKRTRHRTC